MVTIGNAIGAPIPVAFGQTRCNVLIDTGAMKSCMSQTFYQQLMLPTMRSIYMSCNSKMASLSSELHELVSLQTSRESSAMDRVTILKSSIGCVVGAG